MLFSFLFQLWFLLPGHNRSIRQYNLMTIVINGAHAHKAGNVGICSKIPGGTGANDYFRAVAGNYIRDRGGIFIGISGCVGSDSDFTGLSGNGCVIRKIDCACEGGVILKNQIHAGILIYQKYFRTE